MSTISFSPGTRTWLLSTPNSSYGLRLDATDAPCHLHWGAPLSLRQVEALPGTYPLGRTDSFTGWRIPEELAVDGGARYDAPGLQVRFADGTRALEWAYVGHEISEDERGASLTLRMRDRHYPLAITLHYRVHHDSDVIERDLTLDHLGSAGDEAEADTGTGESGPIEVLRADSAGWALPERADYRLSHVIGKWSAEMQLRRDAVAWGETVLTSRRGITSHNANPWVMLDAGDADEDHGQVWSAALAWSGTWRITVQRGTDNRVRLTGGFGHDGVSWRLSPGERLSTPVFAGLYTADGFGAASRNWHAYTLDHVLPHPRELRPVLYNSWEATGFAVDEAGQRKLAAQAAALGVELFVMDDGWFGTRSSDTAGLGDWQPTPERFPDGLGPLVEEVHRLGMAFGLWVEPEMVNPDSELYRRHPEWVLHFENRERTELRSQLVLNFARPDVAEWAHGWLDRLVGEHGIDFLKWDMNRTFSEAGWPEHGTDGAADRLWIDHTRNVYAIIDKLRADHPWLRIEGCSGGGGRVDLGMMARTDQVWPSDNTDALDRLTIQHGFTQLYPARVMAAWVTDAPNLGTGRSIPLRFRCHAAMSGVMGLGGTLTEWSDLELAEVAREVARYKEIRATVQLGTRYRLSDPSDPSGLTAVQYTNTAMAGRYSSLPIFPGWLCDHAANTSCRGAVSVMIRSGTVVLSMSFSSIDSACFSPLDHVDTSFSASVRSATCPTP
jgi:alpha-galactosidase